MSPRVGTQVGIWFKSIRLDDKPCGTQTCKIRLQKQDATDRMQQQSPRKGKTGQEISTEPSLREIYMVFLQKSFTLFQWGKTCRYYFRISNKW